MSDLAAFTVIPVSDLSRCTEFLRDELGLLVRRQAADWTELGSAGGTVILQKQTARAGAALNRPVHLGIRVDDLDETYKQLRSRSVRFVRPPSAAPWGKQATLQDPEGNEIDLVEESTSAGDRTISDETVVNDVLLKNPEAMEVLEEHGIRICGGCIVLLNGTIRETAEYSGLLATEAHELVEELNEKVNTGAA